MGKDTEVSASAKEKIHGVERTHGTKERRCTTIKQQRTAVTTTSRDDTRTQDTSTLRRENARLVFENVHRNHDQQGEIKLRHLPQNCHQDRYDHYTH